MNEVSAQIEHRIQGSGHRLLLTGTWELYTLGAVWPQVEKLLDGLAGSGQTILVDARLASAKDVSGAWCIRSIVRDLEKRGHIVSFNADASLDELFDRIETHRVSAVHTEDHDLDLGVVNLLGLFGGLVIRAIADFKRWFFLLGSALAWMATVSSKGGLRPRSIANHINVIGIGAVPVVALSCFLVGGVIAQQSAFELQFFGAESLAIDLSAYMIFRELGVLIAAIMVAGRSASAMAAELGAMKMREEVDALNVMGLDPVAVLVVPRLLALVIAMPLLTMIAYAAAILGAATLLNIYSGLGFDLYMERMRDFIEADTVISGLIKAPFMALAIGIIGCTEGLKVTGSTESLGRRTTTSVVKAIFAVFIIDGFFAIFFAAIQYG